MFQGVKIYDISSKQRITNVLRDNTSLRPDMYPCSLCWKDNTTLIIGWGSSVKVCVQNNCRASILLKVNLIMLFDLFVFLRYVLLKSVTQQR